SHPAAGTERSPRMSTTLGCDDPMAAMLGVLRSPTRNRYFYGKMLDAHHLRLEQDYVNQMRWLMNRLSLGTGVLCGLEVRIRDQARHLVQIGPGVAVDGLGREIIVPTPSAPFDFKKLADESQREGDAGEEGAMPAPAIAEAGHEPVEAGVAEAPVPLAAA